MIVSLDPESPVPLFEQLRAQLELLIVSGRLAAGTQLPVIRHLATDLGLAKGTVAKVYEALARDGLVTGSGRHGTIVSASPHGTAAADALARAADALAMVAHHLGLPDEDVHTAVDQALSRRASVQLEQGHG